MLCEIPLCNKLLRLLFKKKSKNVPVVTLHDHYDFILIPKQYVRKKKSENYERYERYDFN